MKRNIIINEDNSHYFCDRGVEGATLEKLEELPASYCRGMVGEVFYNIPVVDQHTEAGTGSILEQSLGHLNGSSDAEAESGALGDNQLSHVLLSVPFRQNRSMIS